MVAYRAGDGENSAVTAGDLRDLPPGERYERFLAWIGAGGSAARR